MAGERWVSISFWHDKWNTKALLAFYAPRLYALYKIENGNVKDVWNPVTNDWDIQINHPLREHENQLWDDIKSGLTVPLP